MSEQVLEYNMFPQKTYGGNVKVRVLDDGRLCYTITMPGSDQTCEMVVDPADENDMRAVRQLHLVDK